MLGCMPQVEFNKAALSLSDAIPTDQRKAALNRLLKARPAWLPPVHRQRMGPCGHAWPLRHMLAWLVPTCLYG